MEDQISPLNASDEKEIIKAFKDKFKLEPGEPAYAISLPWFRKWKKYVDFDEKNAEEISRPGPIDNTAFSTEDLKIKEKSILNFDFDVIPKAIWDTLFSWYSGGPVIEIEVAYDPVREKNVPVFKYSNYRIFFKNEFKVIQISKYKKVKELADAAFEVFGLDKVLYHIRNFEGQIKGEIFEEEKIICQYSLTDGQEILIESNNDEEVAPMPKTELYIAPHSQSVCGLNKQTTVHSADIIGKKVAQIHPKKAVSCLEFSELTRPLPGTSGLLNLGNTCYMNSVIQCLFHIPSLLHFFESVDWTNYPMRGQTLGRFVELLKVSWSGTISICNPHELKDVIDDVAPEFKGRDPHDAHEFLTTLLKHVHDDMNIATGKPQSVRNTLDPLRAWNAMKQTDNSPIIDMFFGMCKHSLCCPLCGNKQFMFEPFMSLQLPLPQRKVVTVQFIFVPANPAEPMRSMKLKLFQDSSLEEFDESMSLEIKRKVSLAFAEIQSSSHKATWLPNYQEPHTGSNIYAFEIVDHWKLHAVIWLCIKVKKGLSKANLEMGVPYVVGIPGANTTSTQLLDICDDYFKYLWDKTPPQTEQRRLAPKSTSIPSDLAELREKLITFKKPYACKFKIKLERSMFSKTMRFKPYESAPWIARRNVYAVLNTNYLGEDIFNWSMLRRQTRTSATMPVNRSCAPLNQCFNLLTSEETLDAKNLWYCNTCDKSVAARSQTALWRLPKIMVIQFKRFFMDGLRIIKNDTFVKYPMILDMREFFSGPGEGGRYRLVGVTEHQGSLIGGHYEAKCFVEGPDKWFCFSDTSVKEIPDQSVISPNAYMLFYQRIE